MVTPDAKRKAVVHACEMHGVSQRRACQALRIDRSTVRYTVCIRRGPQVDWVIRNASV
jgi:hypothetical protein